MFLAVILVAVSFVGGFALRSQTELVASWGIPVSDGEREALAAAAANNTFESVSARVGDVEDILSTYSMDEIDLTAATYSMLDDLMKSTGDPYATYYNPDLYNTYIKETTERSYAGIGVVFADYNGAPTCRMSSRAPRPRPKACSRATSSPPSTARTYRPGR